nr:zinc finger, CCHC-type, retrotransposon Gag domain protein [Tanacetum cinerariifolium]
MPYYISQTTSNLKEVIKTELEEFRKDGIMNDYGNDMTTYRDFMACDVPKFDGALDLIASTRWLVAVEGAFRTSNYKEKNKVNFASNFLYDSAKMWWEGKFCEKGKEWIGACTWKEFKELFNAEFTPTEEIDKIREEFLTLMQTDETVNEMWKKFNDLIRYYPEYRRNEKLKVEICQRMLRDDIREVISPFKCTTLDDLLSRAWVREADLLRKKNKEAKETIEFGYHDTKKPKHDQGRKSRGTQIKTPSKKCHKTHLEVCRANFPGCYKCGVLNHMSKDCKKPMILCYNCNKLRHKSTECPDPMAIEAKPLKSVKEEKVEKAGIPNPTARVYMMAKEEDKVKLDVVTVIDIDWLDKYNANILCSQKLVRMMNSQGREIIIYGDRRKGDLKLCSVMKARRYLSCGCHDFMAHVINTIFKKKSVEDFPIVNEFLDAFPKELSGIPGERQGLKVDPAKIEAMMNWQAPNNVGEIRSFLAAQVEELKEENWKSERITPYIPHLEDDSRGVKTRQGRIYIPFRSHVKDLLLEEAHKSKYSIHPGATKMYLDMKKNYWWLDIQSEQTIQTLEDMLRAYVIDFEGNWDDHLPLVEFSYNNSYYASIKMPPYETLYRRRCRTLVCWDEVGSRELASTNVVLATTEKIETICERLKTAQDRWKSYANNGRRPIEFNVRDFVMLKISPWKGVLQFKNKGKLSPRFLGPFKILKRVGEVAYVLELPKEMWGIQNTFHV